MNKNSKKTVYQLDTSGLSCPEPVMLLHKKIREIKKGDVLELIATDPTTIRDIPSFCHYLNHELIEMQTETLPYSYHIRKGS